MSIKIDFFIPSSDNSSRIHGVHWSTGGETKAVLQICHGMVEHIGRYEPLANYLNRAGISVIGHDHLGHGRTTEKESHGIFAGENGAYYVIEDIRLMSEYVKRQYPKLPHFLMGHSMGSFFVRRYLTIYGRGLCGVILMGTGEQSGFLLKAGSTAVRLSVRRRGRAAFEEGLHRLVLGSYNKPFEPGYTAHDWLSRDMREAVKYEADPDCQFIFSNGAYEDLFKVLTDLHRRRQFERIPKSLPVLFLSGARDPVGQNGRGVRRAYRGLEKTGLKDISIKLYPGARHELLNETNRRQVYKDLRTWMETRMVF